MRRTLFILIGMPAMLGLGCFNAPALAVSDLQKQLAGGARVTVVDIRSPSDFAQEHIPGAINIPASLCPLKKLPPLGRVVVCGDGLGRENIEAAAAALSAKPGMQVEILDGGFAGWKNTQAMTTRGAGFKRESFNYITYAQLKAVDPDKVVLYDLRKPARAASPPLTDLNAEFPNRKQARSATEVAQKATGTSPLVVLIDNGDGIAEQEARRLKISGVHNYVILAGGELILARHGQAGLQRNVAATSIAIKKHGVQGPPN